MSKAGDRSLSVGPRAEPAPVVVILGILGADSALVQTAVEAFGHPLDEMDLRGDPAPFDQTHYYEPEMGVDLVRTFFSFHKLVPPERLPEIKATAWEIETRLSEAGNRRVNLDPGILDLHKVVLASFKPGPQKLYLGNAVWADTVLYYEHGAFKTLPWTFPDLRDGAHAAFFVKARQRYKQRLKQRPDQ